MTTSPSLPAPYELVHLDEVDSVRAELARRATAGAEEGLLLWADRQLEPYGRLGRRWLGAPGDLACGVLLRPDFDRSTAAEVSLVAGAALGQGLAELATAMTGLHYQWPNDMLLNGGKVAGLWLDAPPNGDPPAWLGLTVAVNVDEFPDDETLHATSVNTQFEEPVTAADILAVFSRHLLAGLNRWAEEGLAHPLRAWRGRVHDFHEGVLVSLPDGELRGELVGLDDDGALRLRVEGEERRVTLAEFHGLQATAD